MLEFKIAKASDMMQAGIYAIYPCPCGFHMDRVM